MEAAQDGESAVKARWASFAWERQMPPALHDISLQAIKGQLVMVVGVVGSGKSSLIAALLGELHSRGGAVEVLCVCSFNFQGLFNIALRPYIRSAPVFFNLSYVFLCFFFCVSPTVPEMTCGKLLDPLPKFAAASTWNLPRVSLILHLLWTGARQHKLHSPGPLDPELQLARQHTHGAASGLCAV
jgi:energy-coupling factor transporter ATP-binding protein EcfA2